MRALAGCAYLSGEIGAHQHQGWRSPDRGSLWLDALDRVEARIKALEAVIVTRDNIAKAYRGRDEARIKDLEQFEDRAKKWGEALRNVQELSEQNPGGCDHDADPNDPSPQDAGIHLAGLIWQICERALAGEEETCSA